MSRFLSGAVCVVACTICGCLISPHRHKEITRKEVGAQRDRLPEWDWACGIPRSVQRADLVPATIASQALARLLPALNRPDIRLASTANNDGSFQIVQVAGKPVQNYQQLHAAVERAVEAKDTVELAVRPAGATADAAATRVELAPATLLAIEQEVAPKYGMLRVTEDGNPWIVLRDADVRCRITARVERESGLIQVIVSLGVVAGGTPLELPREVTVACNGKPLRCLTVADALELLYDPNPRRALTHPEDDTTGTSEYSFAAVSQSDEYRVPVNYKRLQENTKRAAGLPALAVVPGTFYPGSPVLGDARALSAFLLERQLCHAAEPEKLGWIIFSGESLKQGGNVEIAIDLGNGTKTVGFLVPKP